MAAKVTVALDHPTEHAVGLDQQAPRASVQRHALGRHVVAWRALVSNHAVTRVDSPFNVDATVFNSFCMLIDGFLRCGCVSRAGAYRTGRWTDATDTVIDTTPGRSSIVATGPDAESFLQGELRQDVAALDAGGVSVAPARAGRHRARVDARDAAPRRFRTGGTPCGSARIALTPLRRFLLRTKCALELADVEQGRTPRPRIRSRPLVLAPWSRPGSHALVLRGVLRRRDRVLHQRTLRRVKNS